MIDATTGVLLVILYSIGAITAHEATHYVVALLYNHEPDMDWVMQDCWWSPPDDTEASRKRDEIIRAAPIIVGMLMVPAVYATISGPVTVMDTFLLWAWVLYTIPTPIPVVGGWGASLGDWNGVLGLIQRSWGKEAEA